MGADLQVGAIVESPRPRPIPLRVSASIASATILPSMASTMIAVAMVAIVADFGSSTATSSLIPAYYISTAVTAPMAGRLGAVFGARRVYVVGLLLVAVGSIVGSLAPSVHWLIAAYAVLGTGMATHLPNAVAMLRGYADRYRHEPATGIMIIAICGQSTAALGPSIGGLLVGTMGWHSIMWVNLPVVALSLVAVTRFADVGFVGGSPSTSFRQRIRTLDLAGSVLLLGLLASAMFFLMSLAGTAVWWLGVVFVLLLSGFVVRERTADEPLIDVRALARNRALCATLGRTTLCYVAFYCVLFSFPQWLQTSRGMTPVQAGLMMLPLAATSILTSMLATRSFWRLGARVTLAAGMCSIVAGGVLLGLLVTADLSATVVLLVVAVLGIPNGINSIGNQTLINSVTSSNEVGLAIGMYRTVQFLGANLAAVILQLTAGFEIADTGMHLIGWVVTGVGILLMIGVMISTHIPPRPGRASATGRFPRNAHCKQTTRISERCPARQAF